MRRSWKVIPKEGELPLVEKMLKNGFIGVWKVQQYPVTERAAHDFEASEASSERSLKLGVSWTIGCCHLRKGCGVGGNHHPFDRSPNVEKMCESL